MMVYPGIGQADTGRCDGIVFTVIIAALIIIR